MIYLFYFILPFLEISEKENFDCVYNAKSKESYRVLETGYGAKIYFSGGYGSDFILELEGYVGYTDLDEVMFIKDSFCDWASDVIIIDEEVYGVKKVTKVD